MLLAKEYVYLWDGLSWLQCRHSLHLEWKWRPGYLSEHVGHVSLSNIAMFGWNFHILAWMAMWNTVETVVGVSAQTVIPCTLYCNGLTSFLSPLPTIHAGWC